jgi:hypothetical protein
MHRERLSPGLVRGSSDVPEQAVEYALAGDEASSA